MTFYDIGDLITLRATFTVEDVPTDPTAVTFRVRDPSGRETDVVAAQSSTGVYVGTFTPTRPGTHYWRARGTGDAQAAEESSFEVRRPRVLG